MNLSNILKKNMIEFFRDDEKQLSVHAQARLFPSSRFRSNTRGSLISLQQPKFESIILVLVEKKKS